MCPYIYHIDTYVYIYWIYVSTYILHMHIYEMYIDPHILDVCGSHTYIQHLYLYGHIRVRSTLWLIYLIYWIYVDLIHTSKPISMWTHTCAINDLRGRHICVKSINTYICMDMIYMWTHISNSYISVWTHMCLWSQRQTRMCEIYQHLYLYGHICVRNINMYVWD